MKSNKIRTIGIALAIILGMAILIYLGGLICQLHLNYVQWQADGGMAGKAMMAPLEPGILACWARGLSFTGLKYDLLVALTAAGIYVFLRLQDQGAYNINLVTATQYAPDIIKALDIVKPHLVIPVVYNSGGYERVETLKELEGYVDVYLPDLKYLDSGLSARYSNAPDYFQFAGPAIKEMIRQTGEPVWDEAGILLKKGVVIRHMVLPGCREDSIRLLHWIKETLPSGRYLLSLLSQYTPLFKALDYPEINRPITTFEYQKVVDAAVDLGLTHGYMQEKSSAKKEYTPSFQLEGLEDFC